MNISLNLIESLAPNSGALKNGRDLVSKNKFSNLKIDADKTVIWGECAGSGKNPYNCSADFVDENNPISRCNCPSRQFPCKHGIGLMVAYANGASFSTAEIPDDIASKRGKLVAKAEKKEKEVTSIMEKAAEPKKVNKNAVVKKTSSQLDGIEVAKKLLNNIVQNGISSVDAKVARDFEGQIKDLGNYYIPGIQTAFSDLLIELKGFEDSTVGRVIDKINYVNALLKKATEYLTIRKDDPEAPIDVDSEIEEQIGTVWKSLDLVALGQYEKDASLIQLSFHSYDDKARKEFVEIGFWWSLQKQKVYQTKNYRPYKALKYVKEENSFSQKLEISTLIVYPGNNPRIRWEKTDGTEMPIEKSDIKSILEAAETDFAQVVKRVKNEVKNPLNNKNPFALLKVNEAGIINNMPEINQQSFIRDANGFELLLNIDDDLNVITPAYFQMLIPEKIEQPIAVLVYFKNDLDKGLLEAVPLSLVTENEIIKLNY